MKKNRSMIFLFLFLFTTTLASLYSSTLENSNYLSGFKKDAPKTHYRPNYLIVPIIINVIKGTAINRQQIEDNKL